MKKTIVAVSVAAGVLAVPTLALAQAAPAAAAPAAPASPHTFTGNAGLFSDYRFRGIDQTFGKPAFQGGFDYSHSSGFYAGNWNSNINQGAGYPGGSLEMDFYGGWKNTWGDWGLDLGAYYYYYPSTNSLNPPNLYSVANNKTGQVLSGKVDNTELYIGGSWKWVSLKYSQAVSDYFGTPGSKNSHYLDLSGTYDLGDGWGLTGHVGGLKFKGVTNGDYTDWKIGVTKDLSGWVLGASYIDTNAKGNCGAATVANPQPYCFGNGQTNAAGTAFDKSRDAGKGTIVISVTKTF